MVNAIEPYMDQYADRARIQQITAARNMEHTDIQQFVKHFLALLEQEFREKLLKLPRGKLKEMLLQLNLEPVQGYGDYPMHKLHTNATDDEILPHMPVMLWIRPMPRDHPLLHPRVHQRFPPPMTEEWHEFEHWKLWTSDPDGKGRGKDKMGISEGTALGYRIPVPTRP